MSTSAFALDSSWSAAASFARQKSVSRPTSASATALREPVANERRARDLESFVMHAMQYTQVIAAALPIDADYEARLDKALAAQSNAPLTKVRNVKSVK